MPITSCMTYPIPCPSPAPIPPHFRFFEPFMDATLPPGPDQAQGSLITDLEAIDNTPGSPKYIICL